MTVKKESSAEKVVTITDNNVITEPDSAPNGSYPRAEKNPAIRARNCKTQGT